MSTEGGTDEEGTFHKVSRFNDNLIAEVFVHKVFFLLVREELISRG